MITPKTATAAIEVNLQDCFWRDREAWAIDEATWVIWFQRWLAFLPPDIAIAEVYELTLRFTNDLEIQSLNAQYRHQDRPTDVLAFAALEVDWPRGKRLESEPLYLGDLVISVETAHRQAQHQGHSLKIELAWLCSHGFLHLLGWDHPDEESLGRMLYEQEKLLHFVDLTWDGNNFLSQEKN